MKRLRAGSVARVADQHLPEHVELLEAVARPEDHREQRVLRDHGLRQTGDEVATTDLRVQLFFERIRGRELRLHFLRGALTERERVLALHEREDRLVELVAGNTTRLA